MFFCYLFLYSTDKVFNEVFGSEENMVNKIIKQDRKLLFVSQTVFASDDTDYSTFSSLICKFFDLTDILAMKMLALTSLDP